MQRGSGKEVYGLCAERAGVISGGGRGPVGASQSEPLSAKPCLCGLGMPMGFA